MSLPRLILSFFPILFVNIAKTIRSFLLYDSDYTKVDRARSNDTIHNFNYMFCTSHKTTLIAGGQIFRHFWLVVCKIYVVFSFYQKEFFFDSYTYVFGEFY